MRPRFASSGTCWKKATGGTDSGAGDPALASEMDAHHERHDRGRDHPARTRVDQEPRAATRSGDAPDEER
jgi:hypothetical protein